MSRPGPFSGPDRSSPGFTLVEVLVALTLASVIGGAVVSLILRQNEYYAHQGRTVYAGETVRAAGDLVAAELRSAGPGDLLSATPDSVSVRYDVTWAVVCRHNPSLNWSMLFVYDTVTNANLSGTLGYAASAPTDSSWAYDDVWSPTNINLGGTAKATCTDHGAPDVAETWRYRQVFGWSSSSLSGSMRRGSLVRAYGRLTFRLAPSSFGPGTALWRNHQELVAPFDSASAAFSYLLASGDTVASPATLADVRGVRITATAVAREGGRVEATRDLDVTVWLRNER